MSNDIEIAGEVKVETERAILFFDGKVEEWVPKSQVSDYSVRGDDFDDWTDIDVIFIPEWLALDKGFI